MINLSPLPFLNIIEPVSFADNKQRLLDLIYAISPTVELRETSDEMVLLEAFAYQLTYRDVAFNERLNSVLPTLAKGDNLDLACMNFYGTRRLTDEGDEAFLERSLLSLQQSSTAGAEWSYIYHTKSVDSRIVDVLPWRVSAGVVNVTWYANESDEDELLAIEQNIINKLTAVEIKPIGDNTHYVGDAELHINRAVEIPYLLEAVLRIKLGIDGEVARLEALANLNAYALELKIGEDIKITKLLSLLHTNGVDEVEIMTPMDNVAIDKNSIARLTSATITIEDMIDE